MESEVGHVKSFLIETQAPALGLARHVQRANY